MPIMSNHEYMTTITNAFCTYKHYDYSPLGPKRKIHPIVQFTNKSSCNMCQRQGIDMWACNLLVNIPLEFYMNVGSPLYSFIRFGFIVG